MSLYTIATMPAPWRVRSTRIVATRGSIEPNGWAAGAGPAGSGEGAIACSPAMDCAGAVEISAALVAAAVAGRVVPEGIGIVLLPAPGCLPAVGDGAGLGRNIESTTSVARPATASGIKMRSTRGFMGLLNC